MQNKLLVVAVLTLLSFAGCTPGTSPSSDQNNLNESSESATSDKKFEGTCTVTEVYSDKSSVLVTASLMTDGGPVSIPYVTFGCEEEMTVGDTFACSDHYHHSTSGAAPWIFTGDNKCSMSMGGGNLESNVELGCIYKTLFGECRLQPEHSGETDRIFDFSWTASGMSNTVPDNTLPAKQVGWGPKMKDEDTFLCSVSIKTAGRDSCESCMFAYPADSYVSGVEFECSDSAEQLLRAKM